MWWVRGWHEDYNSKLFSVCSWPLKLQQSQQFVAVPKNQIRFVCTFGGTLVSEQWQEAFVPAWWCHLTGTSKLKDTWSLKWCNCCDIFWVQFDISIAGFWPSGRRSEAHWWRRAVFSNCCGLLMFLVLPLFVSEENKPFFSSCSLVTYIHKLYKLLMCHRWKKQKQKKNLSCLPQTLFLSSVSLLSLFPHVVYFCIIVCLFSSLSLHLEFNSPQW